MKAIYEPRGKAREYSPLACNLYKGCSHGCVYCYAPSATYTDKEKFHSEVCPRNGILNAVEKDAASLEGDKRDILLCFTTDPYQPIEEKMKVTRQASRLLICVSYSPPNFFPLFLIFFLTSSKIEAFRR